MTEPKEIFKAVVTGGKVLLDLYFEAYDTKLAKMGGVTPQNAADVAPTFTEFLAAAGAKIPGVEQAVSNLSGGGGAIVTPPPPSSASTLSVVEARLKAADAEIYARMGRLQLQVQAVEQLVTDMALRLRGGVPAPPTPPAAPVVEAVTTSTELPAEVESALVAREVQHHAQLAEGEEAVAGLTRAVNLLRDQLEAPNVHA